MTTRQIKDIAGNMRDAIIGSYEQGECLRAIAKKYFVSHTTINAWLDRWGVPRRTRPARSVKDLAGQRFGKLTVIRRDGLKYPVKWVARCDCGNVVSVYRSRLRAGIRSCGCMRGRRKATHAS